MWSRIDTEPTTTLGARVALFTPLTSSTMVLRIGRADDSVCVATRGWMLVGDLRWDMTAEWQRPTDSQLNGYGRRADRQLSRRRMPSGHSKGRAGRSRGDRPPGRDEQVHRPGCRG